MKNHFHTKVLNIIDSWHLKQEFVAEAMGIKIQTVRNKMSDNQPREFFNKQNLYKLETYIISKAQQLEKDSEFFQ